MAEVEIRLLGGFTALVGGEPVPETAWRLKKARELVKLLALARGHRLHREQAMDALWPEHGASAAANNLNQAVHVARRALGADAILSRDESLLLAATVDVDELQDAAATARRQPTAVAYRAALALARGELLPENRYDDWAIARRDELADLQAELAAELAGLGADALAPAYRLPVETSSFVGRERELSELRALLAHTRMLTLTGPGGAGKTRLALELARGAADTFVDGAAFVELGDVVDPGLVAETAATALDVRALPGQPLVDALVAFAARRTLLVVVDNCEHVLGAAAALVDALLRGAPGLTVVATSREPLRVPGEVVFRVPSLAVPDPDRLLEPEALLRYESARLFADRAAAVSPGFVVEEANAIDVARICFRLDGLPLALELAAARTGALGAAAVAERLDDRFRLLRAGSRTAPTRQQTLVAALDWSHDLLDAQERVLLRRLAVFSGGFGLEAAETVCSGEEVDAADVADFLARLVEKSLVAVEDRDGARRYRLLESIRAYAGERLDDSGERELLAGRHARWALDLIESTDDSPQLDRDEANLRDALDVLLASDPESALRMCARLWPFWLRRIELDEARRRLADALDRAPAPTPLRAQVLLAAAAIDYRSGLLVVCEARARESLDLAASLGDAWAEWRALQFLAECGIAYDDPVSSRRWLDEALAAARRHGLAAAEAIGIYSLGVAAWIVGQFEEAEERVEESLAAFRALDESPERIPSPANIAEARSVADSPGLRLVFEDTLQPFVEITCRSAVSYVLANEAAIARARGDLVRARALLDESLARFERDDDARGRAYVLARRAFLELEAGSPGAAAECLEETLELRRGLRDRRGIGLALTGLGQIALAAGDYAQAEARLAASREIFERAGDRWGLTSAFWRTADLAFARGRPQEAEAALEEALAIVEATGRARWIALTLAALGEAAAQQGDRDRAVELLMRAQDQYAAHDFEAAAEIEARLARLAKPPQSRRKEPPRTTSSTRSTKRRQT